MTTGLSTEPLADGDIGHVGRAVRLSRSGEGRRDALEEGKMGIPKIGWGGPGVNPSSLLSGRLKARASVIVLCLGLALAGWAQVPDHGVDGILKTFETHSVVGLGELRQCKQQLE